MARFNSRFAKRDWQQPMTGKTSFVESKSSLNLNGFAVNLVSQIPDVCVTDFNRRQEEILCSKTGPN